jgi:lysophospholipase L1-like esterase
MLGLTGPRTAALHVPGATTMPALSHARAALRSAVLGYVPYRLMRRQMEEAPFPSDAGEGGLPGPRPVQVGVIGEATAIGYQTTSADVTVAAQLSHRIARRTGRGVRWQALATPDYTIRTAQRLIRENPQLIVVDVVVVLIGIGDAIRFTPPRIWRLAMHAALSDLRAHLDPGAVILIAEIPPLELSHETPAFLRPRIGRHVQTLNAVTRIAARRYANTTCIPFPSEQVHDFETPDGQGTFYGRVYSSWASMMVEHVGVRDA